MKNKIVIYIIVVYFIVITGLLITQIPREEAVATESENGQFLEENKLKNAVVFLEGSGKAVVNGKIYKIENDRRVSPILFNGSSYIPVSYIKECYPSNVSWRKNTKETVLQYNNKAVVFQNNNTNVKVYDVDSEEEYETELTPIIVKDKTYIPTRVFSEIFDKKVFYCDGLIIISEKGNYFSLENNRQLITDLILALSE